jgi:Mat/Ecp fimbriae major subunit
MKKLVLFIIVLGLPLMAQAQTFNAVGSADLSVSATFSGSLILTTETNFNFGSFTAGTPLTSTIDPNGTTDVNPGTGSARGVINAFGVANGEITFTLPGTVTLSNSGSDMEATLTYAYSNDATDLDTNLGAAAGAQDLNGDGEGRLFVGGTLTFGNNVANGTYTGTVTITAEYN